jgi:hypothetical protein
VACELHTIEAWSHPKIVIPAQATAYMVEDAQEIPFGMTVANTTWADAKITMMLHALMDIVNID